MGGHQSPLSEKAPAQLLPDYLRLFLYPDVPPPAIPEGGGEATAAVGACVPAVPGARGSVRESKAESAATMNVNIDRPFE